MRNLPIAVVLALVAAPGWASSLSATALVDGEDGRSADLDGRLSLTDAWDIGGGVGHGESSVADERFSGTSLRAFTDVQWGGLLLGASGERWKDSEQLRATVLRGEVGWMSETGLSVSALVVDRKLEISYSATLAGQLREFDVKLEGTGIGGDLSWFGDVWSAGVRYIAYDYGNNVDRIRALLDATNTERFPRLQRLLQSMATRAAGAPDRELSLLLARQFGRTSLSADWQLQRDAVSRDDTWSAGLTAGFELSRRWLLDTAVGVSDGEQIDTVPWASVSLTFLSADTP